MNKTITIIFKGKSIDQLDKLKNLRNLTYSQVVQNALRVYNTLSSFKDKDGSIIIESPEGEKVKLYAFKAK